MSPNRDGNGVQALRLVGQVHLPSQTTRLLSIPTLPASTIGSISGVPSRHKTRSQTLPALTQRTLAPLSGSLELFNGGMRHDSGWNEGDDSGRTPHGAHLRRSGDTPVS